MKKIEINIPDGKSGDWEIRTVEVPEPSELDRVRAIFSGGGRYVPAGTYKQLMRNKTTVMSNTPDEIRDFSTFVWKATGSVLVNGLGIGVLLNALLLKDDITKITVIEKSTDVIKLVKAYITDKRVTIINADAFEYKSPKGERYDAVWHDIWDYICADNLDEMIKLHRKYGRKADYQESWCRSQCEAQRKEDRRYSW